MYRMCIVIALSHSPHCLFADVLAVAGQLDGLLPLSSSLIPGRGTGQRSHPLQEAPRVYWITLVVKVGPQLPPSLVMHWGV